MKSGELLEELITRAAARGVRLDLGKPIREFEDYDYAANRTAPRVRDVVTDDKGKVTSFIPGVTSAEGRQTRSQQSPRWTAQDYGHAAAGMDDLQWAAIRWCLGQDPDARTRLKSSLILIASHLKEVERWPSSFRRGECACGSVRDPKRYILDLCTLALLEGADPQRFGSHGARAHWFGLSESHWRHAIARGYHGLYAHLEGWYNGALQHLRSSLRSKARSS
jgi:hypothetical protein